MRAVLLTEPTPAEEVKLTECSQPVPHDSWALVKVRAFGLNHSEQILREFEINADYIAKPIIPGIECVGEIADPGQTDLKQGQKVVALMGGMGRSFNGSYAEYAVLPRSNIFPVQTTLTWQELGAVPETYFTAWGSLFEVLQLRASDRLLIRGATCALGYAAIQLARALGCYVVATTHKESKIPLLGDVNLALLDQGRLCDQVNATKVLDLVGPRYLHDTLRCVSHGGFVCVTGNLGRVYTMNQFDPIKGIPNGVYLSSFFSNSPNQKTIDAIFDFLSRHNLKPRVGQGFTLDQIKEALIAQDSGIVNGKIVVRID